MQDRINVEIDATSLKELEKIYTVDKVNEIVDITNTFTQKIQADARTIIRCAPHVDSGRLINSIKATTKTNSNTITGQVASATDYARFIHEGADHKGTNNIHPFFVPFKLAPSLLVWAKRKGVIYQKTNSGNRRKVAVSGGNWYMTSKKNGKEYRVDTVKGGLQVKIEPTKFLQTPFNQYESKYLQALERIFNR
ncbi:MAG: hypothetical protein ATN35_02030 [Epulopiscium sp. Nele67-Bin004]|nr:MAG: hypothetical protein ATN35_02030 [Epulopiscium sp. Nele67-Bin004]